MTKDPIVMASNAVLQYQTIVSRNIAAQEIAVLTVGAIQAGATNNVIPASALVKLNLRWFNERTRTTLLDGIKRINEGIAIANGLYKESYTTNLMKGNVFPMVNDVALTNKINKALTAVLPPEKIITDVPAIMGSEDFNHLVLGNKKTVCNFIFIGTANTDAMAKALREGQKAPFFNHNGNYQVDLGAIPLGVVIGATAVLEMFRK